MKSYLIIICPHSYEKLPKVKLGQVEVGSNIAQNYSSSLWEHIWPLLAPICFFSTLISPQNNIFVHIYPYLPLPLFTYM